MSLVHWSEAALPGTHVHLIEHAGPWALARADLGSGSVVPAVVSRDRVADLSTRPEMAGARTVTELLEQWDAVLPALEAVAADPGTAWRPLAGATVHSPVEPRQVFQAGANYRTHVIELAVAHHDGSDGRSVGQVRAEAAAAMDARLTGAPFVFTGLPSAICGPYDDVVLPRDARQPDWELELAAVIGRRARRVPVTGALDAVAGWVIVNDLTLREKVFRRDAGVLGADWLAAKNPPTFLPAGPVIVPRPAIPDPGDLRITLRLNGQVMQDESTRDMLFDTARIIAYCSEVATLLPGDLVLTGSPAGNGLAHGRLLRPGDLMESAITGLGAQASRCVAES
jgi:2,4-didehydro-3-deoxy-L-rhamnonate hydrolase